MADLTDAERADHREYTCELLHTLYANEIDYAHDLYDELGWTDDVLPYMRYNANKALANLGYQPAFDRDTCQVNPAVRAARPRCRGEPRLFSGSGSSYVMGTHQPTTDTDWDF